MAIDPYGRAIYDCSHNEQTEPLIHRNGRKSGDHPIERFYFTEFPAEDEGDKWFESWLQGPLLNVGAGVGQHTLHFQDCFETDAIDVSDYLVATMCERGVNNVSSADMFALRAGRDLDR